jgi:hypothetical protein
MIVNHHTLKALEHRRDELWKEAESLTQQAAGVQQAISMIRAFQSPGHPLNIINDGAKA